MKKPQEAQKANTLSKEAGEEYHDTTREDNIRGRSETRLALWGVHLKDPNWRAGQSPDVCGKSVLKVSAQGTLAQVLSPMAAVGFLRSLWEKPIWEGVDPT